MTGEQGPEGSDDIVDEGVVDDVERRVTLVEVSHANWRDIADVAPRDDQRDHVPASAARYLLLSARVLRWLFARPDTMAVRLSYQPANSAARALYVDLGFVESDVPVDDEFMAELTAVRAAPLL